MFLFLAFCLAHLHRLGHWPQPSPWWRPFFTLSFVRIRLLPYCLLQNSSFAVTWNPSDTSQVVACNGIPHHHFPTSHQNTHWNNWSTIPAQYRGWVQFQIRHFQPYRSHHINFTDDFLKKVLRLPDQPFLHTHQAKWPSDFVYSGAPSRSSTKVVSSFNIGSWRILRTMLVNP